MRLTAIAFATATFFVSCKEEIFDQSVTLLLPVNEAAYATADSLLVHAVITEEGSPVYQYKFQGFLQAPAEIIDTTSGGFIFSTAKLLFVSADGLNEDSVRTSFFIPHNFLPGRYLFVFSAVNDQFIEDKDTVFIRLFNPADTVIPGLTIDEPLDNDVIQKGDTLRIRCLVTELLSDLSPGKLHRARVTLAPLFEGGPSPVDIINQLSFPVDSVRGIYRIPPTVPSGAYQLSFMSLDQYNNSLVQTITISVTD